MATLGELTPYLLGLLATAVAWLFKTVIQLGKDVVAIQTAFKFYLEQKSKGAAMVLDSPNPTPPDMRVILRRYYAGTATKEDLKELREWLSSVIEDEAVKKSERSAAIDILSSMNAMKILERAHAHGHR